jgi:hypothetical protein
MLKGTAIVGERGDDNALIWEGCSQARRDDLPATGNDLRLRRACAACPRRVCVFDGPHAGGHVQKYLCVGHCRPHAIRDAQAKISATMMRLLYGGQKRSGRHKRRLVLSAGSTLPDDYFQLSRFFTAAFKKAVQSSCRQVTGDIEWKR